MAQMNQSFPQIPNNAIASYDYVDVADGTGLQEFYLMKDDASTPLLQGQPTRTFNREQQFSAVYTSVTASVSGSAPVTFSLSAFNLPRTIKGTALVEGSYEMTNSVAVNGATAIVVALTKNSEEFASGSTQEKSTNNSTTSGSLVLPIIISNPTHFARDDVLGVKYYVLGRTEVGTGVAGVMTTIGTSPLDEDGSVLTPSTNPGETTITKVSIPFRLDDVA